MRAFLFVLEDNPKKGGEIFPYFFTQSSDFYPKIERFYSLYIQRVDTPPYDKKVINFFTLFDIL